MNTLLRAKAKNLGIGRLSHWIRTALAFLLLVMPAPVFTSPALCAKASAESNYNTDFLKNFIGLKLGEPGWLFRGADLKTIFGPNAGGYKNLARLNKLLKQRGVELIMLPTPTRAIVHPEKLGAIDYQVKQARESYKNYIKAINRLGITTPKLYRVFEWLHSKPLFFARDHHWTSAGAKVMAQLTAEVLVVSKPYPRLDKINYSSSRIGSQNNNGSLAKAAKILCASAYEGEVVENYLTQSAAATDLFADSPQAKVILVGTSNSKGRLKFNFSGFLRQYSQLDVLNHAQSGGGPFGALHHYLASDGFTLNPPLLLIWEVPAYYRLNDGEDFNKLFVLLGEAL